MATVMSKIIGLSMGDKLSRDTPSVSELMNQIKTIVGRLRMGHGIARILSNLVPALPLKTFTIPGERHTLRRNRILLVEGRKHLSRATGSPGSAKAGNLISFQPSHAKKYYLCIVGWKTVSIF